MNRLQCPDTKGHVKNEIQVQSFRLEPTDICQMCFCAHKFKQGSSGYTMLRKRNIQNKMLDPANKKCKKYTKRK